MRSEEAQGETMRRRALSEIDPVGQIKVGAMLKQGLEMAQSIHGEGKMRERIATMDSEIVKQMQRAIA